MNLILIARRQEKLQEIAQDITRKHPNLEVEILVADFSQGQSVYSGLEVGLADKDVGILVNNVGIGVGDKYYNELTDKEVLDMIHANIMAMTMMSKLVLPKMEAKANGAIVNISSAQEEYIRRLWEEVDCSS